VAAPPKLSEGGLDLEFSGHGATWWPTSVIHLPWRQTGGSRFETRLVKVSAKHYLKNKTKQKPSKGL
jgi:hypothetical protein